MITIELKWLVPEGSESAFETSIENTFVPAVSRQDGFVGYTFLREYDDAALAAMDGVSRDPHGYRLNLTFETEAQRRHWASTPEHDHAVGEALTIARELVACGFDVVATTAPSRMTRVCQPDTSSRVPPKRNTMSITRMSTP